jgi:ribosomal protein S20
MAITSSAKKAYRASVRRRVFNVRRGDAVSKLTKEIKKLVSGKKVAEAQALLPKAYKAIDKAAKMYTIHKNTASRIKSRLVHAIKSAK